MFRCTCGENTPHTRPEECAANRAATNVMMSRHHQESLPTVRDAGRFVRFATNEEASMPHGTILADGVLHRWLD